MEPAEHDGDREPANGIGGPWPLVKVLDAVALLLTSIVVARAVGGVVAAFGVPSISTPPGVVGGVDLSIPGYLRLQYGTGWADIVTGLLLLSSVALLALPRMVWEVGDEDRGLRFSPVLVSITGIVAAMAATASVIGIVNVTSNLPNYGGSTEAVVVADGVSAAALAVLTTILCRFAMTYVSTRSDL